MDRRITLTIVLAIFVTGLDSSIVNIMLPKLQEVFQTTVAQVALVGTVYVAMMAGFQLFFGRCADVFSPLRVFMLGLILFFFGSLGCALSQTISHLLLGRAVQGLGAATLAASFGAVILVSVPKDQTGRMVGMAMTVMTLGTLVGPPLGGYLAEYRSWHWAFLINLPLCLLAAILLGLVLREQKGPQSGTWREIDLVGVIISAAAFLLLPGGLHLAADLGWTHPLVWGMLLGSGLAFWLLAQSPRRTPTPLLNFAALRGLVPGSLLLLKAFLFVVLNGVMLVFPFFITSRENMHTGDAGWLIGACALAMALSTPFLGRLVDSTGGTSLLLGGSVGLSLVSAAGFTLPDEPSRLVLGVILACYGLSFSAVLVSSTTLFLNLAPSGQAGVFSALNSLASPVGAALGFSVFSLLYAQGLARADALRSLHHSLGAMVVLGLAMAVLAQACRVSRANSEQA